MEKDCLNEILNQYSKDFGFSFNSLLEDPTRYQKDVTQFKESFEVNKDTVFFSLHADKAQIDIYDK